MAFATEFGVTAEDPVAALDTQRRRAVIESGRAQVPHRVIEHVGTPGQIRAFVQRRARFAIPAAVVETIVGMTSVDRSNGTDAAGVNAGAGMGAKGENAATAVEIGVSADLPSATVHDLRMDPVIEAIAGKVRHRSIGGELAAAEVAFLVERDAGVETAMRTPRQPWP